MRSEELLKELVRRYDILIGASGLLRVGQEHIEAINELQEVLTRLRDVLGCPKGVDMVKWAKATRDGADKWSEYLQRGADPVTLVHDALGETRSALGPLYHRDQTVAQNVARVIQKLADVTEERDSLKRLLEAEKHAFDVLQSNLEVAQAKQQDADRTHDETVRELIRERDTLRMENHSLRQQIVKWWAPARVDNTLNTYRCRFRTKGWLKDEVLVPFDDVPATHYRMPVPWGGATDFRCCWGKIEQTPDGPALVYEAW